MNTEKEIGRDTGAWPGASPSQDGQDATCPCESVWQCMRGRTRLNCELQAGGDCYRLNLMRNSRVYGTYQFAARDAALSFATRLRATFEGNGWSGAESGSQIA